MKTTEKPGTSPSMPLRASFDTDIVGILVARAKPKDLKETYGFIGEIGGAEACLRYPEKVRFNMELRRALSSPCVIKEVRDDLKRWGTLGIRLLPYVSDSYPELLRKIFDPPALLFYRGQLPESWEQFPGIGVVGSRNADRYGIKVAADIGRSIVHFGGTVISGLALGIDGSAHRGALEASSSFPTVAVLGSGVDKITPGAHRSLGIEILNRGGVILSQFEPGSTVRPSNFIDRNRVISGLSLGVVVVQARERSGALSTAHFALSEGREVLAVPGPVDTPRCSGSNALLKDGAHLLQKAEDLLDVFPQLKRRLIERASIESQVAGSALKILGIVREKGPLHIEELKELAPEENFQSNLLELELQGAIARLPGNMVGVN